MEKSQSSILVEVLKRLGEHKVLDNVLLIGSWCNLLYETYFQSTSYTVSFRTRDVDFYIRKPLRSRKKVDIALILEDLDFVIDFRGSEGYTVFAHDELIIEFLVADKGKGDRTAEHIDKLGVTPQAVRYLNMLDSNPIEVEYEGIYVGVPHPVNFALHKLLISTQRKEEYKSDNDRTQGIELIRALIANGDSDLLRSEYGSLPKGWKSLIDQSFENSPDDDLLEEIKRGHVNAQSTG